MQRIAVAMSGGVDSSVAALLLQDQGYEVAGITMCLGAAATPGGRAKCCSPREVEDARRVCRTLGIAHQVVDFGADLEEKVIRPFVAEYRRGRTPNPCVACNREIKFGLLMALARSWGYDGIATGHYAAIEERDGLYRLRRPKDRRKDQTYFLYAIPRETLAQVRFPLADLTKDEVRRIAREAALPVAEKPESQDVCFIPEAGCATFLEGRGAVAGPGEIVDRAGRLRGRHRGIACYTIGQRGGLGISAPEPLYVLVIDAAANRLVVGAKADLRAAELTAVQVNRLVDTFPAEAWGKIRYAHRGAPCRVAEGDGRLAVRFGETQEAITPGQSIVLYQGDTVLGGGIIEEVASGTD